VIAESGAIVDYIIRRHGGGRLQTPASSRAFDDYVQWAALRGRVSNVALLLKINVTRLGSAAEPLLARIQAEIATHLGYIDATLKGRNYVLGAEVDGGRHTVEFRG